MKTSIVPAIAVAVCLFLLPRQADAAIIITAVESGGDVVFSSAGGMLNLGGLTFEEQNDYSPTMRSGSLAFLWLGAPGANIPVDNYRTISGPTSFGSAASSVAPDFGSGGLYGVDMTSGNPLLSVPRDYVSGDLLDPASMTYSNTSFTALQINQGVYVWSWGDGDGVNGDTLTLNVVPEPSSTLLLSVVAASWALFRRRRRI